MLKGKNMKRFIAAMLTMLTLMSSTGCSVLNGDYDMLQNTDNFVSDIINTVTGNGNSTDSGAAEPADSTPSEPEYDPRLEPAAVIYTPDGDTWASGTWVIANYGGQEIRRLEKKDYTQILINGMLVDSPAGAYWTADHSEYMVPLSFFDDNAEMFNDIQYWYITGTIKDKPRYYTRTEYNTESRMLKVFGTYWLYERVAKMTLGEPKVVADDVVTGGFHETRACEPAVLVNGQPYVPFMSVATVMAMKPLYSEYYDAISVATLQETAPARMWDYELGQNTADYPTTAPSESFLLAYPDVTKGAAALGTSSSDLYADVSSWYNGGKYCFDDQDGLFALTDYIKATPCTHISDNVKVENPGFAEFGQLLIGEAIGEMNKKLKEIGGNFYMDGDCLFWYSTPGVGAGNVITLRMGLFLCRRSGGGEITADERLLLDRFGMSERTTALFPGYHYEAPVDVHMVISNLGDNVTPDGYTIVKMTDELIDLPILHEAVVIKDDLTIDS